MYAALADLHANVPVAWSSGLHRWAHIRYLVQLSVVCIDRKGSCMDLRCIGLPISPVFTQTCFWVLQVADFKREKVDLSNVEQDPNMLKLPFGYHWYETMLVLRATLSDEER